MIIPSYCYERVESNIKAIERLQAYKDAISSFNIKEINSLKAYFNALVDEIHIERSSLYKIDGKDTIERMADHLQVASKNADITHYLMVDIDSLTHAFMRTALEEFHECAAGGSK